jgi:hypothetical protein
MKCRCCACGSISQRGYKQHGGVEKRVGFEGFDGNDDISNTSKTRRPAPVSDDESSLFASQNSVNTMTMLTKQVSHRNCG